ncbi:MAG: NUDIX hydrolase [Lachnospiraceae bacterium]|nr:NUDIX hydrolase [Lachnospiraceae bacterium]
MGLYLCEILKDLLTNLIKVTITGGVLWGVVLLNYYLKRNQLFICKGIKPSNRVFRCMNIAFEEIRIEEDEKKFKNIFDEKEKKQLLAHSAGKKIFDGDMVRLSKVNNNICFVQKIKYFDFLTTNLIFKPASSKLLSPKDALWHMIFDEEFRVRNKLENRLKSKVAWYGKLKSFDAILNVDEFANAIATSVVLRDNQDRILIVKRSNKNAISSGDFAVSATGSLKIEDLEKENPFICAGLREVKEELNLDVPLKITDIIIVKQKYQPVILMEGKIEQNFSELVETIKKAIDYNNENTKIYAVPCKEIRGIARKYKFTDTSIYQLAGTCNALSWFFTKKRNIHKYELK